MFGRGDKSLAHFMARRHAHNYVDVWRNDSTTRKHVEKSEGRGFGMKFMEADDEG